MIIDSFTKHSLFSLPLIFGSLLTENDLRESDFVNMYTCDVNKPTLCNHIFLVFHNLNKELLDKLRKHHLYSCDYGFSMDNIKYCAVVFVRAYTIYSIVNKVDHGLYYNFLYEDKLKILQFWNAGTGGMVHRYLFDENTLKLKPNNESITKYT